MAGVDVGERHDLMSILSGDDGRDFLVRNNGDQVKLADLGLDGKIVGIYFSGHWCPPCRSFTPKLAETYTELSPRGTFEVVFVSSDHDEDSFRDYLSEMPWLAVPFSDSAARSRLEELFEVEGIPHLVILDGSTGKVLTAEAVMAVSVYGAEAFPFTSERMAELEAAEEAAKRDQTLKSVLTSASRDYVVDGNGDKVPVSELEGKIVGIYFGDSGDEPCAEFTKLLAKMYGELKERGERFEVVLVSFDDDKNSFQEALRGMPWFAVPFKDRSCERLIRYFDLDNIPTLVVIGVDGKTLNANAAELVEEHGVNAYPFDAEKMAELEEIERVRAEAQTLESLLVSGELNYVIGKENVRIPVSELVGKNILLYFSAHWCPPCRAFTPTLIEVYHEIKAKYSDLEVVFISSDHELSAFEEYYSGMPWLALPFGDERKNALSRKFKIEGIPSLVAISPSGRTVNKNARGMVMEHGSAAYPFTEERVRELKGQVKEMAQDDEEEEESGKEGYVCDGDVCYKK